MWLVATVLDNAGLDLTTDLQETQKEDKNVQLTPEVESVKSWLEKTTEQMIQFLQQVLG